MAARLYKCYGTCGGKFEKAEMIEQGGKNYCKSCAEAREKEQRERNELYNLIKELYKITYPTGMMMKQIKNYKEQFNYTYDGIMKTLRYLSGKPGIEFKSTYGLGIITYKYDEAQEYYKRQNELAAAHIFKSALPEAVEEIVIKTNKPNNTNAIKKERMINLEDLI